MTMEQLMAASTNRPLTFTRGDSVEGTIAAMTSGEMIVDLSAKTEGVISKKDIPTEQLSQLKVGDSFRAYVAVPENEYGQTVLSLSVQSEKQRGGPKHQRWDKFIQGKDRKTTYNGTVTEVNKGGLLVEVDGARGFIPGSQISLANIAGTAKIEDLVGQTLPVIVMEVDLNNNRLIFSARKPVDDITSKKLAEFKVKEKITGRIAAVTPFGLFLDLEGIEGMVFSSEVSWEEAGDLSEYKIGQTLDVVITGVDEELGRVNLSLRQLEEDPFTKIAAKFQADDVVTGTITEINQNGLLVKFEDGVEGLVPAEKLEPGNGFTVGQTTNFLVDSVDARHRRINLAPFITTTKGLIYK